MKVLCLYCQNLLRASLPRGWMTTFLLGTLMAKLLRENETLAKWMWLLGTLQAFSQCSYNIFSQGMSLENDGDLNWSFLRTLISILIFIQEQRNFGEVGNWSLLIFIPFAANFSFPTWPYPIEVAVNCCFRERGLYCVQFCENYLFALCVNDCFPSSLLYNSFVSF